MWHLIILELDNYVDSKTGERKHEVVERFHIRSRESLANFLLNIKKDLNKNPEFFCVACGYWTSYQIMLQDSFGKTIGVRNLFDLFMDNKEMVFGAGMTFTKGTPFLGVDVVKWLEENQ